jgi:hypothetical protein
MNKEENLNAVVIISEDNLFITNCKNKQHTIQENAFFEHVFGIEVFKLLMSELHKEGFNKVWIIIDHKIKGDELLVYNLEIEYFKSLMLIRVQVGIADILKLKTN